MPEQDAVWVESDRTVDGRYFATVHATADVSIPLDKAAALAYAQAVYLVAELADYDAAIAAQVQSLLRGDQAAAAVTVKQVREQRGPIDASAVSPLRFTPVVSARDGCGYVHVHCGEQQLGQWTTDDARSHASQVMRVVVVVDLDTAYHAWLTTQVGLDTPTATAAVHGLQDWRTRAESEG